MTSLKKVSIILIILLIFNIFYPIMANAANTIEITFEDRRVYDAFMTDEIFVKAYVISADVNHNKIWVKPEAIQGTQDIKIDGATSQGKIKIGLGGLEKFTELRSLILSNNEIESLEPLRKLTKLEHLNLKGNKIKSVEPLKELTNLKELMLDYNQIADISDLRNLTKLEKLIVTKNNIEDISVLSNFKQLRKLNVAQNHIKNISVIDQMIREYKGTSAGEARFIEGPYVYEQTITESTLANIETSKKIQLPAIFQQAMDSGSKGYIPKIKYTGSNYATIELGKTVQYTGKTDGKMEFRMDNLSGDNAETRGLGGSTYIVNVDVTTPELTIKKNPDTMTNQNVRIEISANENLKLTSPEWRWEDPGIAVHDAETTGTYEFSATDIAGNPVKKTISVTNIDKTAPILGEPKYTDTSTGVIVTIVSSKVINENRLPEGWHCMKDDKKTLFKEFKGNGSETVVFYDTVGTGNPSKSVNVNVSKLNNPVLTITVPNTQNVKEKEITINSDVPLDPHVWVNDEDVTQKENWRFENGNKTIKKKYTTNMTETITVKNAVGSIPTNQTITITGIDCEGPKFASNPEEIPDSVDKTYSTIVLRFNEELSEKTKNDMIKEGWEQIDDKYRKTFYRNGSQSITVQDKLGNENTLSFDVTKIEDKDFEVKETIYSPEDLTNGDVTVTIIVNKPIDKTNLPDGWSILNDSKTIRSAPYKENKTEKITIKSLSGEEIKDYQIVVNNIDKKTFGATVNVLLDPDRTSVEVTVTPNKEIKSMPEGWKPVGNSYVKTYYDNVGYQSITIEDKVGNKYDVTFTVKGIILEEFKVKNITYSTKDLTKDDVTVNITVNKEIDKNQRPEGWDILDDDPKTLTKTYSGNATETITIKNLSGEEIKDYQVVVNNIDKNPLRLEVEPSTKELTNQPVKITIKGNRKLNMVDGWERNSDTEIFKFYEDVVKDEQITVTDILGNTETITFSIENIDKTPPKLKITKNPPDNVKSDKVVVTIESDKELKEVEGWKLSEDKKVLTKEFGNNTIQIFNVYDLAGNKKDVSFSIKNIERKIETKKEEQSDGSVKYTITSEYELKELEGWELSPDKKVLTKIYKENAEEEILIYDKDGYAYNIPVKVSGLTTNNGNGNGQNSGNSGNSGKQDPTTAQGKLPNAGTNFIVIISIIVMAGVAIVSKKKLKEYNKYIK